MDIFQFVAEIANNQLKPTIVDTVEGTHEGQEVMFKFIGYALPSCTSPEDPKWLIQLHVRVNYETDGEKRQIDIIGFANGVRKFDQTWEDRASLSYKPTQKSDSFYDDGVINLNSHWFPPSGGDNGGGGNES